MSAELPDTDRSRRLMEEAEETLRAIQYGAVDAFVVQEPDGHRVYTLEGSDLPYSALVERMQQGAAMLDARGCVVYCNLSLAQLLGMERESVIGRMLQDFLAPEDQQACEKLLKENQNLPTEAEMQVCLADGRLIPAEFLFYSVVARQIGYRILITDLTAQKQQMEFAARLQSMQDEERRRLARELHDSVGQTLVALGMNLQPLIEAEADSSRFIGGEGASENIHLVDQISREIRIFALAASATSRCSRPCFGSSVMWMVASRNAAISRSIWKSLTILAACRRKWKLQSSASSRNVW